MKNQSGRTLVEMLSVLAIIGVLSIVGIVMYKQAIIKYSANELVHDANLAYIDLKTQSATNKWTSLSIGNNLQGYSTNDKAFILVEGVNEDVCTKLIADKTNFTLLTMDNLQLDTCQATNNIVFDFANIGSMDFTCQKNSDCYDNQYCSNLQDSCVTPENCGNTAFWNKNIDACENCPANASINQTDEIIGDNGCYCNDNYVLYEDACMPQCIYNMMMSEYDPNNYTISGNHITYNGEMIIDEKLDLTHCTLTTNGVISIKSTGELNVDTITVNNGAASVLYTDYDRPIHAEGIWNNGKITTDDITITIKNLSSGYACATKTIMNYGEIYATTITTTAGNVSSTSTTDASTTDGLTNIGLLKAKSITATAGTCSGKRYCYSRGLTSQGTLTADTIIATGKYSKSTEGAAFSAGLYPSAGVVTVSTLTAKAGTANGYVNSYSAGIFYMNGGTGLVKVDTLHYCPIAVFANYSERGTVTNTKGETNYTQIKDC